MVRTITSAVAFSVFVSFFVWMSVLATQTGTTHYSVGPGIFHPQLDEEDAGATLH